jgi:autophagy-related protein 11
MVMSILVYIGHTGQRLVLDPRDTSTVDALRTCISTHAGIQPRNQILLTLHGKQVRPQTLLVETELFVFDSAQFSGTNAGDSAAAAALDDDYDPGSPPDTLTNQNDLAAWQNLFKERRQYADALLEGCTARAALAQDARDEQVVIERSLAVAVASLQHHIKSAEKQFASTETWANDVLKEQQTHTDTWEDNLARLRNVAARPDFARFLLPKNGCPSNRRLSQQPSLNTLQAFIDVGVVQRAATTARANATALSERIDMLRENLRTADRESMDLRQAADQLKNRNIDDHAVEPDQLIEEIGMVVRKMASDLEHVRALPKTTQSVSQASKMALLHTRQYLTSLNDYRMEINELVHQRQQERADAAMKARKHMQTLSSIESQLAKLYQDMKAISVPEDQQAAFKSLSILSRLPSVYGHLLVESVRRREWVTKMKHDTSALQEEVATYQEEEEKRRKKWSRIVDDVVNADALQDRVLGIELSLQNEDESWPDVARQELQDHLKNVSDVYGPGQIVSDVEQAIKDLDKPTRQQVKHAKAFKQGSVHEATFGNTSLLLRGDEQHRALRDANLLLEQEVKAHKSRVVKLESLLYRANQASRTSTGEVFTPLTEGSISGRSPIGQTSEDFSRNSSLKPRRQSFAQGIEEKKLVKRVVDLEAELQSFKDDAHTRKASDAETQKQVEDALSMKRDLMENMEAQQREFANERRGLEKELAEAKDRAEELENEMERMAGSRDGFDYEIARLKDDAAGHAARAATEFDARRSLELKLSRAETAHKQVEQEAQALLQEQARQQATNAENRTLLATAWAHLAPGSDAPADIAEMAAALEDLARRSAAHAKDLEEAVSFAKAENQSLWASNERQKTELSAGAQKQGETEALVRIAEDRASAEEARAGALEEQLRAEQEQLRISRSRFAEGETGSEALRQRVAEEEARANSLSVELAEARSHHTSLDAELTRLRSQVSSLQTVADTSTELLDGRRERAKEVSQRLFSQNARLVRLLDRLGLVISYQDDAMVIERASKMGASTANMLDASGLQLARVTSITSPPGTRKPSTTEPEAMSELRLIQWMNATTADDENAQFEAFLKHIAKFDLDVFSDAITKRVKDFEYTAKKYNKEAKESTKRAEAYKERALKLRHEAHTKIAVRDFKEGDLALFLPTRGGQVKGAWAAFNIGCPHFFLAERDGMRLGTRDFIVARIQKVEQKIVDLGRTGSSAVSTPAVEFGSEGPSSMLVEDDNPFDLSDGLTWWMVHAVEERGAGAAPTTPGLGKSTVAVSGLDAKGSIRIKRSPKSDDASKHLNKSLESRRSSSASKKSAQAMPPPSSPKAAPTIAVATDSGVVGFRQQRPESQHSSSLPRQGGFSSSPLGLGVVNNTEGEGFPPHPQQIASTSQHHPLLQNSQSQHHPQHHYQQTLQLGNTLVPHRAESQSVPPQAHLQVSQKSRAPDSQPSKHGI